MEKEFRQALVEAISNALGPDAMERPILETANRLGLPSSRETIRRVLNEEHVPAKRMQDYLLKHIQSFTTRTADEFLTGQTLSEVLDLLGRDALSNAVPQVTGASDVVLEQLANRKLLLRCLDDQAVGRTEEPYFAATVAELAEQLREREIDRALLITHSEPKAAAVRFAESRGVVIETYATFIRRLINLDRVQAKYEHRLASRDLLNAYQPLPALDASGDTDLLCANSFSTLLSFLSEDEGPAVATILGSYGSGKTSLALKIAHRIAQQSTEGQPWIIPLWINARTVDLDKPEPHFVSALSDLLDSGKLGAKTVSRLISSGRIWLFVDGLDENPSLRRRSKLVNFVDKLLNHCYPNGRLILTVRQELIKDRNDEVELFRTQPATAGAARTLILRTQPLDDANITKIIRGLLDPAPAARLLNEIGSSQPVTDLSRRPVFLHLLGTTARLANSDGQQLDSALHICESYVRQWSEAERKKTERESDLPVEERLRMCELMALFAERFGEPSDGISTEDIEALAMSRVHPTFPIRNLEAFVTEARIAMFLERDDTGNRFRFSHATLKSFFAARCIGREVVSGDFKDLEYIELSDSDPLLIHLIVDKIRDERGEPYPILTTFLQRLLDWEVSVDAQELFSIGPCFSNLVPNVAALVIASDVSDANGRGAIDLRGANLAGKNLDDLLANTTKMILLDRANLEEATLGPTIWARSSTRDSIPPGNQHTYDEIVAYCQTNELFQRSSYAPDVRADFVLIPGGTYGVGRYDDSPASEPIGEQEIHIRSFLIQRFPVTNGEFAAFLRKHPEYAPTHVREDTSNDYYLRDWPRNESDSRFSNPKWLNRPVVQINWQSAAAFAASCGLRLPTEVEWEVAARFGQEEFGPRTWTSDEIDGWAICRHGTEGAKAFPEYDVFDTVPEKLRNWATEREIEIPFHMLGLVREWVADQWDGRYPCEYPRVQPFSYLNLGFHWTGDTWIPSRSANVLRVLRGSSFQMTAAECTCHYRYPHAPGNVNPDAGFRCVRPIRVPWSVASRP